MDLGKLNVVAVQLQYNVKSVLINYLTVNLMYSGCENAQYSGVVKLNEV